jgi:putative heme-binding domain-containing protein
LPHQSVGELLTENWKAYSPSVRNAVVEKLMVRADRVQTLLDAVKGGQIKSGEVAQDRKQLLQNHPDKTIRTRARKLFGKEINPDREKVIKQYAAVLGKNTDVKRGQEVFIKNCSTCHKVGDKGFQVGPDLASVKNKSADDMLISILDPNREAQANFTSYVLVTTDGKLHNGIIASESGTSITLREAEAKETTVLRSNIEELSSSGLSLMPQGMEKNVTPEQMADVVAFLKKIGDK